tara:strand:- start:29 stop:394 length:366 start_codon:yes stop_codon:yes gene_type:complete
MRKYIVLLLINGIVWAQTDYDKLVLKNGKEYLGEYVKTERKMLYFKPQEEMSLRVIPTRDVQTLELQDGTFVKINVRTNSDSLRPIIKGFGLTVLTAGGGGSGGSWLNCGPPCGEPVDIDY